jgi:hypothetical protein
MHGNNTAQQELRPPLLSFFNDFVTLPAVWASRTHAASSLGGLPTPWFQQGVFGMFVACGVRNIFPVFPVFVKCGILECLYTAYLSYIAYCEKTGVDPKTRA